jgi:hypothetical protein
MERCSWRRIGCDAGHIHYVTRDIFTSPVSYTSTMISSSSKRHLVAMSHRPPQHGLEWKYQLFDVVPSWTVEPDMAVAKSIAIRHLPLTSPSYDISFFSAGAFNRLFLLHPLNDAAGSFSIEPFIMRVSLPVDPYFKTASEVATLQFGLSRKTPPYLFHESLRATFSTMYETDNFANGCITGRKS